MERGFRSKQRKPIEMNQQIHLAWEKVLKLALKSELLSLLFDKDFFRNSYVYISAFGA